MARSSNEALGELASLLIQACQKAMDGHPEGAAVLLDDSKVHERLQEARDLLAREARAKADLVNLPGLKAGASRFMDGHLDRRDAGPWTSHLPGR